MIAHIWKELLILLVIFGGVWAGFSYYNYDVSNTSFTISAENEKEMSEFVDKYMMQDFEELENTIFTYSLG